MNVEQPIIKTPPLERRRNDSQGVTRQLLDLKPVSVQPREIHGKLLSVESSGYD